MVSDPFSIIEPSALAIVLIGTALATTARSGWRACAIACRAAVQVFQSGYDPHANRTAIARWVNAIQKRGLLGAEEAPPPDPTLAKMIAVLVRHGSLTAMDEAEEESRIKRQRNAHCAAQVFEHAGEIAPVFGLVGTLFAMTQIAPSVPDEATVAAFGAIATAVFSSLYGVLSAHLVFLPLANAIMRKAAQEEDARSDLYTWLYREAAGLLPGSRIASIKPAA